MYEAHTPKPSHTHPYSAQVRYDNFRRAADYHIFDSPASIEQQPNLASDFTGNGAKGCGKLWTYQRIDGCFSTIKTLKRLSLGRF
jgi:hypothetical protein